MLFYLFAMVLLVGNEEVTIEVARTPEEKERGLMGRTALLGNHGMLFIFDSPVPLSFWMKNTLIPLSIGFFDGNKRLLNIEEMAPNSLHIYSSSAPAQYALEMPAHWFETHHIEPGATFELKKE